VRGRRRRRSGRRSSSGRRGTSVLLRVRLSPCRGRRRGRPRPARPCGVEIGENVVEVGAVLTDGPRGVQVALRLPKTTVSGPDRTCRPGHPHPTGAEDGVPRQVLFAAGWPGRRRAVDRSLRSDQGLRAHGQCARSCIGGESVGAHLTVVPTTPSTARVTSSATPTPTPTRTKSVATTTGPLRRRGPARHQHPKSRPARPPTADSSGRRWSSPRIPFVSRVAHRPALHSEKF
jgi:hypothetical protein